MTLLNILGGGLFIIPLIFTGAAIAFYLKAKSNQKKGSEWVDKAGIKHYSPDILPIYKSYYFIVAVLFAVLTVLFLIGSIARA